MNFIQFRPLGLLAAALVCFSCVVSAVNAQDPKSPYEKDMQRFEKENADNPPTDETTFFVGSSTFTIWNNIPKDFKEFNAVNRGFGGSQITDWLNFACDRVLVDCKPRRIVFFCGCNDIAVGKSAEDTFSNFKKFLNKMRDANPNLVMHFCALHMPPVREKNWEEFRKFNASVKALADIDPNIYYVDFAAATSDENGAGRAELFRDDRLHLKREGEEALIPLIKESIKKELQDANQKRISFTPAPFKGSFDGKSITSKTEKLDLSQAPVTVQFARWSVKLSRENNVLFLSLVPVENGQEKQTFAQTKIAADNVQSIETYKANVENDSSVNVESVGVDLKSGCKLIFSNANEKFGFVTIDYSFDKKVELKNEIPVVWEFPNLVQANVEQLKAFGTAGLKAIDGHQGSYAFLSVVDPKTRSGAVGGWITSEFAGGVVKSGITNGVATMSPQLDFGNYQNERVITERFVLGAFDDCRIGLENYADAIAAYYSIVLNKSALNGYCTWYSDKNGGASNENALKELAKSFDENFDGFGFQYVQIDDSWQLGASKNGPNKNFTAHKPQGPYPSGIKATSDFLKEHNLLTGLWFMPFSGNFDDPYWADKQDFFVRSAIDYPEQGQKNTRRYPSINQKRYEPYETFWGGTALDMSNPKAVEYVDSVVSRITQDWNCKFIKIDGMWVGSALEQLYVNDEYVAEDMGKQIFFDRTRTNIENFRVGMEHVRSAAKGTFILGCNVSQNMRVLASSYGLVDAMRVGPDNGASWDGVCAGPWRGTNRYFYNARVWYNDPDPVYVRRSIPVERAQVSATWASISGQLYALSDWIPDYDAERVDVVRKTVPNHQCKNVRPVDLFDADLACAWILTDDKSSEGGVRRDVVALFNWHGEDGEQYEFTPEKLGLPLVNTKGEKIEKYVAYDFWNNKFVEPFDVLKTTLAKESCKVFAIRPVEDRPILLSTSRHITQGVIDVIAEKWDPETKTLQIEANLPKNFKYELRVYNPATQTLDVWTAPEDCVGIQSFEYKLDENSKGAFSVSAANSK